uniref:gap junction alpha-8 protein-like n=1 Tax=Styela clava TaxID=7725 RepID=UPI00193A1CAE|nr:gap junction alpha-8 protein-like [Styela clava]
MAWHILHGLLEQVRVQSTFPGKLWIVIMFIFRIVVVARIGDMVYHDEQSSFVCNTLTPGCENVCFNRFSPISQLRYWSLMVLVVSTPSILFYLYAMHIIYHADVKYPADGEDNKIAPSRMSSEASYIHPPSLKRRRDSGNMPNGGVTAPLYEVKKINTDGRYKTSRLSKDVRHRHRRRNNRDDASDVKGPEGQRKPLSVTDNNEYVNEDVIVDYRGKYPIYVDTRGRRIEYMKDSRLPGPEKAAIDERKMKRKMLEHPELYRAYWWHVFLRTLLEAASIVGQYYLYGLTVHELYECPTWPCPKTVDCFVSRPQEKTCLLWLMYVLGGIACILSLAEFWVLGIRRAKVAFMCCTEEETFEERKRRLALLESHGREKKHDSNEAPIKRLTSVVSLDSLSSDTTVESV